MPRVLAIDYGSKRVGLAVTDPLQIIATGLATVHSTEVISFLEKYCREEEVEKFVVGEPKKLDNTPSQSAEMIDNFVTHLHRKFPEIPVERIDERFTSVIAKQAILASGKKKKSRQDKSLVDTVSATLILQTYLERTNF